MKSLIIVALLGVQGCSGNSCLVREGEDVELSSPPRMIEHRPGPVAIVVSCARPLER